MQYVILVSGYRDFHDYNVVKNVLNQHIQNINIPIKIIHGGAAGVDELANRFTIEHKLDVQSFPADWKKYGNAAGPIRNAEMLKQNPDICIMFMSEQSKGTKNMLKLCKAHKKEHIKFEYKVINI